MNNEYLERAKKIISDPKLLCIAVSKRANQLAAGSSRPMVKCNDTISGNHVDIALLEIAEGKLDIEQGSSSKS